MIKNYLADKNPKFHEAYIKLDQLIAESIDPTFEYAMSYGIPGYQVPLSVYPQGYLNKKDVPLPFLGLAIQKNFIAIYHMGIMARPDLRKWFEEEYQKQVVTKLDFGKSCLRLKNPDHIPYDLIQELITKMSAKEWIELYEKYNSQKNNK